MQSIRCLNSTGRIIDATHDLVIAYKPNIAFYECLGASGWKQLELTINYIRENYPEIFIIADAKRGDIGNTSKKYAETFFSQLNCDAVTVAPYMGSDSVLPFLEYPGKWVILLALTSNQGADDFQIISEHGNQERFLKQYCENQLNGETRQYDVCCRSYTGFHAGKGA